MKVDISVVRSLPLFEKMSTTNLESLLSHSTLRRVPAGDTVFEPGAPASQFFLLLHGRLKVTQVTCHAFSAPEKQKDWLKVGGKSFS